MKYWWHKGARIVPVQNKGFVASSNRIQADCRSDLHTQRNISNPVKITVKSFEGSFTHQQRNETDVCEIIFAYSKKGLHSEVRQLSCWVEPANFSRCVFGRGTGIHGTTHLRGIMLKELLGRLFPNQC
jgi:hypothetical protein